jgi:hypothetical protein
MSIFGKKPNGEHSEWDQGQQGGKGGGHPYGIGDVISLLRTLPIDQHGDLVARVIASTLESLKVRVSDLIQGASKREQELRQRIGVLQGKMIELTKQIEAHRQEVSLLEADLAETTHAKERLQSTAQTAAGAEAQPPRPVPLPPGSVLPLPLAPPVKAGSLRPPETTLQGAKD